MIKRALRLSLGVTLIIAASAVLLLTDRGGQRVGLGSPVSSAAGPQRVFSVALLQHISQPSLEEGANGMIAALAAGGYRDGGNIRLRRFNAEGDAATSNTIARELVGGEYDLILTLSTPSLQAVAGANREAKVPQVFGLVTDPVAAGVGIARDDPMKHPPYMVGLGTMQPVAEAFRMVRELAPKLTRVGVAWNPSEANSEACTKVARSVCRELQIELLEANVDNSAGVRESIASVVGRGAEAIWVGGDVTVLASLESVIGPARSAGIPVFTNIPGCGERGSLFDLVLIIFRLAARPVSWPSEFWRENRPRLSPSFTRFLRSSGSTRSRLRSSRADGPFPGKSKARPTWWSRPRGPFASIRELNSRSPRPAQEGHRGSGRSD